MAGVVAAGTAPMIAGLLLALFSAVASAFAHALLKSGDNKLATVAWIRICEFILSLPFVLWIGLPPDNIWPWLIAAVAVQDVGERLVAGPDAGTDDL